MAEYKKIVIGIQARSTSERLPGKIHMLIAGKPILDWVIESAKEAAIYINKNKNYTHLMCSYYVLCPKGDDLIDIYNGRTKIIYGSENDVLSRYVKLMERTEADYIVRITADCPMLPGAIISKAINTIVKNKLHYVSNVDERFRIATDGFDIEIMTKEVLLWLKENATEVTEKEHVTLRIRTNPPDWLKVGHILPVSILTDEKFSVDTLEDYIRVKNFMEKREEAYCRAKELCGEGAIYRF